MEIGHHCAVPRVAFNGHHAIMLILHEIKADLRRVKSFSMFCEPALAHASVRGRTCGSSAYNVPDDGVHCKMVRGLQAHCQIWQQQMQEAEILQQPLQQTLS